MAQLEPVAMRLEVIQGVRGCTLINDAYNSDVASLDIALDFMNRRPEQENKTKTLILSDILQTGLQSDELYAQVADMIASRGINHLIGVGTEISAAHSALRIARRHFSLRAMLCLKADYSTRSTTRLCLSRARASLGLNKLQPPFRCVFTRLHLT